MGLIRSCQYKILTFIRMKLNRVHQQARFRVIYGRIGFNVLRVNINRRMKVMLAGINQWKLDNG